MNSFLPAPAVARPVSLDEHLPAWRPLTPPPQPASFGSGGLTGLTSDRVLVRGLTQEPFRLPVTAVHKDGAPPGQLHHYYHASLLFDELEIATCASVGSGAGRGFFGRQHMARFFVEHCSQGLARFAVAPLLGSEMDMWLTGAACVAVLVHRLAFLTQMAASSFVAIPPALQLTERTLSDLWAQAFTTQLRSARPEELRGLLASAAPCHPPALFSPQSEARWQLMAAELFQQASLPVQGLLPPQGFLSRPEVTSNTHENLRNQREEGGGRLQSSVDQPMRLPVLPAALPLTAYATSRDTVRGSDAGHGSSASVAAPVAPASGSGAASQPQRGGGREPSDASAQQAQSQLFISIYQMTSILLTRFVAPGLQPGALPGKHSSTGQLQPAAAVATQLAATVATQPAAQSPASSHSRRRKRTCPPSGTAAPSVVSASIFPTTGTGSILPHSGTETLPADEETELYEQPSRMARAIGSTAASQRSSALVRKPLTSASKSLHSGTASTSVISPTAATLVDTHPAVPAAVPGALLQRLFPSGMLLAPRTPPVAPAATSVLSSSAASEPAYESLDAASSEQVNSPDPHHAIRSPPEAPLGRGFSLHESSPPDDVSPASSVFESLFSSSSGLPAQAGSQQSHNNAQSSLVLPSSSRKRGRAARAPPPPPPPGSPSASASASASPEPRGSASLPVIPRYRPLAYTPSANNSESVALAQGLTWQVSHPSILRCPVHA
jgi:hypothetical protein